ncbi:MAG: hypothetical protein NTU41_06275 [Chloroflexi bacterium]|nr:hypothetical protein [Chloroflexota bacterium]
MGWCKNRAAGPILQKELQLNGSMSIGAVTTAGAACTPEDGLLHVDTATIEAIWHRLKQIVDNKPKSGFKKAFGFLQRGV